MTIRGIVFDIGGVLETTPDLGVNATWEQKLNLRPGEMDERLGQVWRDGTTGAIGEAEVHQKIGETLGISAETVNAMMADIWEEYLGTLNAELAAFFAGLRPAFRTAILSNSFVGAREREQERYHFDEMCDFIIYSHEVGMYKPDRRIYALTCARLGLPPQEVLFLDNTQKAVDAAREFGMHGVLFIENAQAIVDIQACIRDQAG